jgi:diacylglycerol kinase (ATP)
MPKPGATGLRRIADAARYSWNGFRAAWRNESAFRQESALAIVLVPGAFLLGRSATETALLLATLGIVLITELLNSAVESVVDRIGDEVNDLSGRAKDLGSAAVFVALALVVIVWSVIAWDRFG